MICTIFEKVHFLKAQGHLVPRYTYIIIIVNAFYKWTVIRMKNLKQHYIKCFNDSLYPKGFTSLNHNKTPSTRLDEILCKQRNDIIQRTFLCKGCRKRFITWKASSFRKVRRRQWKRSTYSNYLMFWKGKSKYSEIPGN